MAWFVSFLSSGSFRAQGDELRRDGNGDLLRRLRADGKANGRRDAVKFRVRKPTKECYITYTFNGEVIKKIYKQTIIPSEMEIDPIPKDLFKGEKSGKLVVSLTPKEVK